jgi:hypothetical protein
VAKNIIKINRGDSYKIAVSVPDKEITDKNYILTGADALYFALLYPHQKFEDAIIIKGYDHTDLIVEEGINTGKILIKIEPKDTIKLAPGVYYYTVKLYKGGTPGVIDDYSRVEEVRTIIERTKFIINE